MDSDLLGLLILFTSGIFAGILNVSAGGGSTITLPILIFMGLDTATANGTNRLGILIQNTSAIYSFKQEKYFDFKTSLKYSLATLPGAIAGAYWAVTIDDKLFKILLSGVILFVIATLFIPRKKVETSADNKATFWVYLSLFFAGIYGGVVQAGIGFIMMSILYNLQKLELIKVNMHKVFIVFIYTLPVIAVFILSGKINWILGISLALGNAIGAKIAVKLQIKKGDKIIKMVLVVVLIIMVIKLLNIF